MPRHSFTDLRLRLLSALVIAPLALLVAVAGGLPFAGLAALMGALSVQEWVRLVARHRPGRREMLAMERLAVTAIVLPAVFSAFAGMAAGAVLLALLTLFVTVYCWRHRVAPASGLAFGVVYIGTAVLTCIWLRDRPEGGALLTLWLIIGVSACDIGAFIGGRLFGGAKLAPRISPAKTWSGAISGLVFSTFFGLAFAISLGWPAPLLAALIGGAAAALAQLGDLFESLLKRSAGLKDSGSAIPGHGGMLDRVDGFLAATPGFALMVLLADLPATAVAQ